MAEIKYELSDSLCPASSLLSISNTGVKSIEISFPLFTEILEFIFSPH